MNMHGFTVAPIEDLDRAPTIGERLRASVHALRYFLAFVIAPTALLAAYYYLIAADQYQSESHFVVTAAGSRGISGAGGLGSMLGISVTTDAQAQSGSVADFLRSHDAVAQVRKDLPLVDMFRRPEADFLSRMHYADPSPERLLRYYRNVIALTTDKDNGITTMTVRTFRPEDSYVLNKALLALGERQVNQMNRRSYHDAVALAETELAEAERDAADIQRQLTSFRRSKNDVDPAASGEAQIKFMADLRARIVEATSQLETMRALIRTNSPQYVALEHRVESLNAQLAQQQARLSGGSTNMANSLGSYEELKVRQDFAAKRYQAAAASLAKAREDALRQQLYLIRVVDADKPVQSLYPERGKILLTVFIALSMAYGIAWLVLAGVREHAA